MPHLLSKSARVINTSTPWESPRYRIKAVHAAAAIPTHRPQRPFLHPPPAPSPRASTTRIANVIRLSLGKLLVNQLQVVKRTNTPLNSLTNIVVGRTWVFGSWVRSPPSTIISFSEFPHVELEKYSPWYPQEMKRLGYSQRSAVYPADLLSRRFRAGECYKA